MNCGGNEFFNSLLVCFGVQANLDLWASDFSGWLLMIVNFAGAMLSTTIFSGYLPISS